jgi:hypothetical protein
VLKDDAQVTIATLNLRVDDGIVLGDKEHPRYQKAVQDMNRNFKIKEWQNLKNGVTYLGSRWTLGEDGQVTQDMQKYIEDIPCVDTKKEMSRKEFRSMVMKLAWPEITFCRSLDTESVTWHQG